MYRQKLEGRTVYKFFFHTVFLLIIREEMSRALWSSSLQVLSADPRLHCLVISWTIQDARLAELDAKQHRLLFPSLFSLDNGHNRHLPTDKEILL